VRGRSGVDSAIARVGVLIRIDQTISALRSDYSNCSELSSEVHLHSDFQPGLPPHNPHFPHKPGFANYRHNFSIGASGGFDRNWAGIGLQTPDESPCMQNEYEPHLRGTCFLGGGVASLI
jgi:hypothetical protein